MATAEIDFGLALQSTQAMRAPLLKPARYTFFSRETFCRTQISRVHFEEKQIAIPKFADILLPAVFPRKRQDPHKNPY
jgi:hypothetical protein